MDQATSVVELRQYVQHWKDHGQSIAFIPTMGNLHAGHMSLIEKGQSLSDRTICSIFVNPMQFAPNEDYASYPHTMEQDTEAQMEADADVGGRPYRHIDIANLDKRRLVVVEALDRACPFVGVVGRTAITIATSRTLCAMRMGSNDGWPFGGIKPSR